VSGEGLIIMDSKMRERFQHRLSPQLFSSDDCPETENDSDEDIIHSYLPQDGHDLLRAFEAGGVSGGAIPAINITIHSPNANHVLESEICQLADIQESIQRMREGEAGEGGDPCRLSSSCPSLAIESGQEGETPTPRRRGRGPQFGGKGGRGGHRKARGGRARSPSESTGESEDEGGEGEGRGRHQHQGQHTPQHHGDRHGGHHGSHHGGHHGGDLATPLHKSVSTPSMAQSDVTTNGSVSKSRRTRVPEPTHVFIQKLIAEHGWNNQRSCTDSETEGEAEAAREREVLLGPRDQGNARPQVEARLGAPQPPLPSPQLTLAQFLQDPALSEEERSKRRRNKKERGSSLFSLRKKKDKKGESSSAKGLAKAGSAVSLQSRVVTAPRVPQHSYSMSSLKRYPGAPPGPPPAASQFYLARSESRCPSYQHTQAYPPPVPYLPQPHTPDLTRAGPDQHTNPALAPWSI